MKQLKVSDYTIHFTPDFKELGKFLLKGKYSSVFILVDENTKKFCLPLLLKRVPALRNARILQIKSGEQNKNLDTCTQLWKQLMDYGADRETLLINLGGGVIGDLGGFVASTYMRGVDFIQIPTTLLAMVDASVGGKLGVDLKNAKNMVGLFKNPKAIFMFTGFLKTLPTRQFKSGFVEMVKHALIADKVMWEQLKAIPKVSISAVIPFIQRSIGIKKKIVEADPYEKGMRKLLNFGHTIGHAVESYYLHKGENILHGEAISVGIFCEAWISFDRGLLDPMILCDLMVDPINFPYGLPGKKDIKPIMSFLKYDKKRAKGKIRMTQLYSAGKASYDAECSEEEIMEALNYIAI